MKKELYVKNKGLAITAGVLMAIIGSTYLGGFLLAEPDFTNVLTYSSVLQIIAMFVFAVMAIAFIKKNTAWIILPTAVYLLVLAGHGALVLINGLVEMKTFYAIKCIYILLLLVTIVLFLAYAFKRDEPRKFFTFFAALLALWCIHSVFPLVTTFLQDPGYVLDALKEYDTFTALLSIYTPLRFIPIFLLALSLDKREIVAAEETAALPQAETETEVPQEENAD